MAEITTCIQCGEPAHDFSCDHAHLCRVVDRLRAAEAAHDAAVERTARWCGKAFALSSLLEAALREGLAECDRLRALLRDLVASGMGTDACFTEVYEEYFRCRYCGAEGRNVDSMPTLHEAACPWRAARELLAAARPDPACPCCDAALPAHELGCPRAAAVACVGCCIPLTMYTGPLSASGLCESCRATGYDAAALERDQLRALVSELKAENAQLRDAVEGKREACDALVAENVRLRNTVRALLVYVGADCTCAPGGEQQACCVEAEVVREVVEQAEALLGTEASLDG